MKSEIGKYHQHYEQGLKLCEMIVTTLDQMPKNQWNNKQRVFVLSVREDILRHKSATPKEIQALIRCKNIVEAWHSVGRQGR